MPDQPKTPQGWAQDYLRHRLGNGEEWINQSKIPTCADLKEGELFIRFPMFRIVDDKLVFINTELYRKIRVVRYMEGPGGYYNSMRVISGSFHEIPDNEPVIVIK